MKKKLVVSLAVVFAAFANLAYADITMYSSAVNVCPNISGRWVGTGSLSNWMLKCSYNGSGQVSSPDGAGRFTLSVTVDKNSGSVVCPKHVSVQLPGSCNNGVISLNTSFGNIQGHVNGNSGSASGKMTVSPGVNADVKIQIHKVG